MSEPVVIVGGGISGLTLAYRLSRADIPYVLLERSSRLGGNIETVERDGYLYDVGPDSFLRAKRAGEELVVELGLKDELVTPNDHGKSVLVAYDGALHPMPEGLTLGVPKRPWPLLGTSLLSPIGKCRALLEPWVPPSRSEEEETIHQFLTRRLGHEMAERLAAPLLSGVFAGDARSLSMSAAFGQLLTLERKHGSLFSGLNGGKSPWSVLFEPTKPAASPFVSLRRGLGSLVSALITGLQSDRLRTEETVASIEARPSAGYWVRTSRQVLGARAVVIAGPPWMAAPLISHLDQRAGRALSDIRGFATATVFFALDERSMAREPVGSGFIVPPGEGSILAATFVSSKWSGRAPKGGVLVRAFVGGARSDIDGSTDERIERLAHEELTRLLGLLGPVQFSAVHRYQKGTTQPEIGHQRRLDTMRHGLARYPGLFVIGSGYGAVGIPDCIAQANQTAADIAGLLHASSANQD